MIYMRKCPVLYINEDTKDYLCMGHTSPDTCQDNWKYLLEKYISNIEDKNILDVGCGTGQLSYELSRKSKYVIGIDTSLAFKDRTRSNNVDFIRADCHYLPFKDETFEIVISIGMLEHVADYERSIFEMKRVLKGSGSMFLFLGPTLFWRFLDTPRHRSIVTRNPSTLKVLSLLKDGKTKKIWRENVSYRFLKMEGWKFSRGPTCIQHLFEKRLVKIFFIHVLATMERFNLEQNICLIWEKTPG